MTRVHRPGSFHAMLARVFDVCGRGAIEAETGFSRSRLSNWDNPDPVDGRAMPVEALERIARLFPDGALVVARHFAALAGASVTAAPSPEATLSEAAGDCSRSVAELVAELLRATDPRGPGGQTVTPKEARALLEDALAAQDALATIVDQASAAAFDDDAIRHG